MKRILILYRELAGYFVECLNHLCEQYNVEAHVIAYPVHSDAPFQFRLSSKVHLFPREKYTQETLESLVQDGQFNLIFVGGWFDKGYLRAIKDRKCPALLGFDTQWNGSLKHIASSFYGRFTIKPKFEYAFVPGSKQKQFARHLGFSSTSIITGAYACDVLKFSSLLGMKNAPKGRKRKLIYAGRYAPEKFLQPLCRLFNDLSPKEAKDWELHCIGTGALWKEKITGNEIIHHGFLQPDEMFNIMKEGDAFILPSTFEPWGVVVHEFAAAGYPLILSTAVGASEVFLEDGINGFLFETGNIDDLRKKLCCLFLASDETLENMGKHSNTLAHKITPDTWAKSLYSIM